MTHPQPRIRQNHAIYRHDPRQAHVAPAQDDHGLVVGAVSYGEARGGGHGNHQPNFFFSRARRSRIHCAPTSSWSLPKWSQYRDTSARSARVIAAMKRTLSSGFFGRSFAFVGRAMTGECTATMSAILSISDIGVQLKITSNFIIPLYSNVTDDTSVIGRHQ